MSAHWPLEHLINVYMEHNVVIRQFCYYSAIILLILLFDLRYIYEEYADLASKSARVLTFYRIAILFEYLPFEHLAYLELTDKETDCYLTSL